MKVNVTIDCTPEEARTFLGLPDVQPMKEAMMQEMTQRLQQAMQAMDPDTMMKTWMPASMQGWEQMQKLFWNQMASSMNAAAMPRTRRPARTLGSGADAHGTRWPSPPTLADDFAPERSAALLSRATSSSAPTSAPPATRAAAARPRAPRSCATT